MTEPTCPQCGSKLKTNALTSEYLPCSNCGSVTQGNLDNPEPDPEHQGRINKQKLFESGTVIVLIILGLGYFSISNRDPKLTSGTIATVPMVADALLGHGYESVEVADIFSRNFQTFKTKTSVLHYEVDVISSSKSDEVQALIMAVTLPADTPFPPDDVAEKSIQQSFDAMVDLGDALLPGARGALEKAAATVTTGNGRRLHIKGVAQTSGGWKVTYIAYREYESDGDVIPLLLFIYQRLSDASTPEAEAFSQVLHKAVNNGTDIKTTLIQNIQSEKNTP
ncbi:MAG: hypothetical protein COA73_02130 [Candidatus Hydrogenedentota bacterium]|nr:MAG: hypothetical protein COA73_02130 [Candidatus Hydrogenedentota bacterium]